MREKLFVYGTLMDSGIQKEVFGREISGVPDSLYGYRLGTVTFGNETFPAVRKISSLPPVKDGCSPNRDGTAGSTDSGIISEDDEENGEVKGIVLTLSGDDLINADIYEGEYYRRTEITLKSGITAYLYEVED